MFYVNLDVSELGDILGLEGIVTDEFKAAGERLTAQVKNKIIELADQKLHTRRGMFIEALSHFQLDDTTWVVNLDASARWIDEGLDEHSMLEDLLKSKKAKVSKDGNKYVVVPFQLNKPKQQMTPAQQSLLNTVKKELGKVGATPNKIENDASGKPKLGLVRSLDITKAPLSTAAQRIGAGPRGHVAQGPTGIPLLKGVRVYQKEIKDKGGQAKVGRFVMTFRTASQKHTGRWKHPGLNATDLMEEGMKWALEQWENKLVPEILGKMVAKIS